MENGGRGKMGRGIHSLCVCRMTYLVAGVNLTFLLTTGVTFNFIRIANFIFNCGYDKSHE